MRLAFVHPFLFRYARGIERFTFSLSNALSRAGADISILTWRWPQPIMIGEFDPAVKVRQIPVPRYYAAQAVVPFYVWHLLRQRYDFVWICFAGYGEAGALRWLPRQRFGIIFHYPLWQVPHRYNEFKRFNLISRARPIVAVSQYVADGVREFCGRDSAVIPHGVDANWFKPDALMRDRVRRDLNLPPEAPLLLSAAALEERKGIQHVLRALPAVIARWPQTNYLVVGDGDYRLPLEQLAQTLGVAGQVAFLGAQADVRPYYQAADVAVTLARGEASSLATLEAMACALPVIVADRPPFDELVDPAVGLTVAEADERQVAQAILALLDQPTRRQALGANGRRKIVEEFTWPRAAARYLNLLNSMPGIRAE